MRGKKGPKHTNPTDPPRRRANKRRGHGTFATDRPPVAGVVGRQTAQVQRMVLETVDRESSEWFVGRATQPDVALYTDEWGGYAWVSGSGWAHATVCHTPGQRAWARDDDGDGVREVHPNTLEGIWTGLRNFRGVSKWLEEYVGIFQWAHNLKATSAEFIQALLGRRSATNLGP